MQADGSAQVRALDTQLTADPSTLAGVPAAPAATLVIFGAGGDLTKRLLMPALYNLAAAKLLDPAFMVLGVDRVAGDDEVFRGHQGEAIDAFLAQRGSHAAAPKSTAWPWLRERLFYVQGDLTDPRTYEAIGWRLEERGRSGGAGSSAVFYLAVADRFFGPIIDHLAEAELLNESGTAFRRVVIEKPFGHDLASAERAQRATS